MITRSCEHYDSMWKRTLIIWAAELSQSHFFHFCVYYFLLCKSSLIQKWRLHLLILSYNRWHDNFTFKSVLIVCCLEYSLIIAQYFFLTFLSFIWNWQDLFMKFFSFNSWWQVLLKCLSFYLITVCLRVIFLLLELFSEIDQCLLLKIEKMLLIETWTAANSITERCLYHSTSYSVLWFESGSYLSCLQSSRTMKFKFWITTLDDSQLCKVHQYILNLYKIFTTFCNRAVRQVKLMIRQCHFQSQKQHKISQIT